MEFRLRTTLQAEVILLAVGDNLLNDGTHLIDLDGIDDEMFAFIIVFSFGFSKASRRLFYAIVQNVRKSQQHGSRDVGIFQVLHHVGQVDLYFVFSRTYVGMAFVVDAKVVDTPSFDVVQLFRVFDSPLSHGRWYAVW